VLFHHAKKGIISISSYFSYKINQEKIEGKFAFLASNDIKKPSRFEKHV